MYYFGEDGKLVKAKSTFNTLYGNRQVIRELVYGSNGELLKSASQYFDLQTGQKTTRRRVALEDVPTYKTVSDLPFFSLVALHLTASPVQ